MSGYDVFVLAGQSNMVSVNGPIDHVIDALDPNILQYGFHKQIVEIAADPLRHQDETTDTVGMGMSFAKAYIASGLLTTGRKILLVPVARGGSAFGTGFWRAGGGGDVPAIDRTNASMSQNVDAGGINRLGGILWHQGESDQSHTQAEYEADLDALITRWRASMTGASVSTPFVCGGLLVNGVMTGPGVSAALSETPSRTSYTGYAPSTELVSGGDELHFDAASLRAFGGRYFSAWQAAKNNIVKKGFPVPHFEDAPRSQ